MMNATRILAQKISRRWRTLHLKSKTINKVLLSREPREPLFSRLIYWKLTRMRSTGQIKAIVMGFWPVQIITR